MAKTYLAEKNRKPAGRVTANTAMTGTIETVTNVVKELVNSGATLGSLFNYPESWDKPYQGFFYPMLVIENNEITAGLNKMSLKPGQSSITEILLLHGYRTNKDGQSIDKGEKIVDDKEAYILQSFKGTDIEKFLKDGLNGQAVPITATMIAREGRAPIQSVDIDYARLGKADEETAVYSHPSLEGQPAPIVNAFQEKVVAWKGGDENKEPSEAVLKLLAEKAILGE